MAISEPGAIRGSPQLAFLPPISSHPHESRLFEGVGYLDCQEDAYEQGKSHRYLR
jgi:hypothetical protein